MPATLTRFVFAAAIACAALPVWGAGMPDYGTKNFNPGGATPSYFTNENSAVLGTAENESTDDGADMPTRSAPAAVLWRSAGPTGHHHGKLASRRSEPHAALYLRGKGHAPKPAGARSARTTSMGGSVKPSRPEHATLATAKARTAGSNSTKSAKSNVRHASARFSSRKG
jgi:hypothetical protein